MKVNNLYVKFALQLNLLNYKFCFFTFTVGQNRNLYSHVINTNFILGIEQV